MLLASPLQRGEDLQDPYGAKESYLEGFVGTGVPRAAHATGWRHEAWGKESVGAQHWSEGMKQSRVTRRES